MPGRTFRRTVCMTNKLQNTEMIICLDCVNFDRSAAQVQAG